MNDPRCVGVSQSVRGKAGAAVVDGPRVVDCSAARISSAAVQPVDSPNAYRSSSAHMYKTVSEIIFI